ncbi:unnamed protein product [Rhizoctonia solani]|uniref:Uncharacterized protein n=1 Tax=Rhizoctonia solani TaxID=456999 RepID=A0A8H2XSZ1_9AGAM|nr:unnamed protein product [Rhizoctonia solani]
MTDALPNEIHHKWGRTIAQYPKLYTQEALSAQAKTPVDDTKRAIERRIALNAIQKICQLGNPGLDECTRGNITSFINLEKLKCILATARFADELYNFALRTLVARCIVLVSSVKPLPFQYEYGYICFEILVIALNACLLKHVSRSDWAIKVVNEASPNDSLSAFWDAYPALLPAQLICNKENIPSPRRLTPLQPWITTLSENPMFDTLLALLDADQKNFSIALIKGANPQGLFGLLHALSQYLETELKSTELKHYGKRILMPYTRFLYRCRIVAPNSGLESHIGQAINNPRLEFVLLSTKSIDLEDSRNIVQAYSSFLDSDDPIKPMNFSNFMSFVVPFVVPGCEDLIGEMLDACVRVLWNFLSTGLDPVVLGATFQAVLVYFSDILERFNPSRADDRPWVLKLMDRLIYSGVMELILRFTLIVPTPGRTPQAHEDADKRLKDIARTFILLLVTYTSDQYRKNLLCHPDCSIPRALNARCRIYALP